MTARATVAIVAPGSTWGEVADVAAAHGLAAAGGHVSVVGIAGLTLGGGNGWLSRKYGLACDNLVSAEVLTASGRVVTASAAENEGLFWAIRGGGGNFGIVVRFTYRLHPVATGYFGMVMHRAERAAEALRFLRDVNASAPDEVSIAAGILTAPPEPFVPAELQGEPVGCSRRPTSARRPWPPSSRPRSRSCSTSAAGHMNPAPGGYSGPRR